MKLFVTSPSPYARTARVTLRELGLEQNIEEVFSHPFDNEPQLKAANPLVKVPCLLLDNGEAIFDSEVICEYLDQQHGSGTLFAPLKSDWSLRTLYSLASGLLDSAVALQQENKMREPEHQSPFWRGRFEQALTQGLAFAERQLPRLPDQYCAVHTNLGVALAYLDFRHPQLDWRASHQALQSWFDTVKSRSSFLQTQPET